VRERLAVSNQAAQKIDMERFNVKNLNVGDVKEQNQVTISNRAWDNIRENIKILVQESLGYCETKHRKTWFYEECSQLVVNGSRLNYSGCRTQMTQMNIT
jgi:hypothetical protein